YPPYFSTMLGAWKLLAAVVLLSPRRPLLKEWAYAGLFFDFSAAVVSHAAVGDGAVSFLGPIVSIAALFGSWYLRPQSRRLTEVPTCKGVSCPRGGVRTERNRSKRARDDRVEQRENWPLVVVCLARDRLRSPSVPGYWSAE